MKKETIKQLLDNYFEGETSLAEEKILRDYFRQDAVDAELESYRPMFQYFAEEQEQNCHSELDSESPATIGRLRVKPAMTRVKPAMTKLAFWLSSGIAACLAIFFYLYFTFTPARETQSQVIAYIDGKEYTDVSAIRSEMLDVLDNLEEDSKQIFSSQIELLDTLFE